IRRSWKPYASLLKFGMKFGKEFRTHTEETLPEWRDKFLCYKLLKKLLKHVPTTADSLLPHADDDDDDASSAIGGDEHPNRSLHPVPPLADLHDWFVKIIGEELEKFNDFFVDKEEEFIIRLQVTFASSFSHPYA
ncbi:SPX domain-containing protein, partial [Sarracenia purpurea var. burkii]